MQTFERTLQRIARYRICLERDTGLGLVSAAASPEVDRCYGSLDAVVRAAQIELEAAGGSDDELREHLIAGCAHLAKRLFVGTYRESDPVRLRRLSRSILDEARLLMESLWARLEAAWPLPGRGTARKAAPAVAGYRGFSGTRLDRSPAP